MSSVASDFPKLGRYEVIDRIAAGGMAEVFLARAVGAMGFHRLVAVKLIHANFTRDPEFVKMFIDEARIAMHLHHRNIVQVFDLDKVEGTFFLAMEYVQGVNLYDLYERIASKNRWVEVPMALYLVAEICKGLHFAHTRTTQDGRPMGIVHRDVSPQNILLSFEGEVKITDFGIATAAERLHHTAAGIVKGKYAYMAPERLQEGPIDARVDVFSAGVLLYELLVGENPFAGASAVETIEAVLGGKVEAPSERGAPVPSRLDDICLRALAKRPQERWPSAQALSDALTELAMELTYARKDMASGDAAVAQLLAELFPQERARPMNGRGNAPLELPGLDAASLEETVRPMQVPEAIRGLGVVDDDLDAPTVLRPAPSSSEPDPDPTAPPVGARESTLERSRWTEEDEEDDDGDAYDDFIDRTAPTELPDGVAADPTIQTTPVSLSARPPRGVPRTAPSAQSEVDPGATTLPAGTEAADPLAPPPFDKDNPDTTPPVARPPMPLASSPRTARPSVSARASGSLGPIASDPAEALRDRAAYTPVPDSGASSAGSQDLELVRRAQGRFLHRRWLAPVLFVLAAATCALTAVLVVHQSSATRIVEVPLRLRTRPPGAEVRIDGQLLPNTTPTEVSVLAGKPMDVEFRLQGHQAVTRTFLPNERRSAELNVDLPKMAEAPSLERSTRMVTLRPRYGRWAHIYRDGADLGPTPVTVELPVGRVELEVVPEGSGRRRTVEVRIPATGPDEVAIDLR